jgi:hypothetical protein
VSSRSPYATGGGSSSASPYATHGGRSSPHHGHGFLHALGAPARFTGHLIGDVRDAVVGLPAGLVMLAQHPVRSAEVMGKTTWHDWSPLFHGHVGEFAHNLYDHPLAPILDVAGFVTAGAGFAARGGKVLGELGMVSKESRLAKLGNAVTHEVHVKGELPAYRQLDKNPAVRLRQRATMRIGQELSDAAPSWFGRTRHTLEDGTVEIKRARVRDLSNEGFSERFHQKQESYRAGATKAMIGSQIAAFVKAGEDIVKDPSGVAKRIEAHGREQLSNHAIRVSPQEAEKLNMSHYRLVAANPKAMGDVRDVKSFENNMANFASRHTTSSVHDALVEDGKYLAVHKRGLASWGIEAQRSSKFLTKLYKYPTQAWKYAVLAARPAYFVNNAVGNTFMAMASLGPMSFARGLTDAFRQTHGEAAAARALEGADRSLRKLHGDWQDKWYLGVHQGFGQEAMSSLRLHDKIPGHGRTAQVVKVAEQGLYPITHKVADVFLRRVMVNELMRQEPELRRLTAEGLSFDKAADRVSADPAIRDRIQEQVNHALGDYHHLNPLEHAIRNFVPFYTWDRAIMRHGVNLALDRSGRAAALAAAGTMGTSQTEKLLGDIPDFMKGLLVLPGHGQGGRSRVLSTQGLNPYASIADVLDTAGSLVGVGHAKPSDSIAGQLNPLITGFIESITGQSLLSGAKLPNRSGGVIGRTVSNTVEALPQIKLLETLIGGEAQPKPNKRTGKKTPFLYRKNARAQIAGLLGVPVKELDRARAHDMAAKARGGSTKKRRRSSSPYATG